MTEAARAAVRAMVVTLPQAEIAELPESVDAAVDSDRELVLPQSGASKFQQYYASFALN